jgi:hypothetical protein
MQDLSGRFAGKLNLVPSSMSGGNTLSEGGVVNLAMTAPGSPSINPHLGRVDILPQPQPAGPQIPVSNGANKPVPAGQPAGGSFGLPAFTGTWKATPGNG